MKDPKLLELEDLPVYQNKMFATAEDARNCPRGDLRLVQDPDTGLICNAAFDPALLEYDQSYQNEQGHSAVFGQHLEDVLDVVDRHFSDSSILEVGCGKGAFLEQMRRRGHAAKGIDPAYEGTDPNIIKSSFASGLGIHADAVVLRHTLEHIPDPLSFLDLLRVANHGEGLIYVEVPCLDWILSHRAWFDFFYEHVNYFRLPDFGRIFGRVLESGRLFGGQYLYAVADLASLQPRDRLVRAELARFPADLFQSLDACVERGSVSGKCVVWGAAAKGVMFAHHASRCGLPLEFAIDINPAKQSGHLAGTGLAVLSPEHGLARLSAGDTVFVMNSNYFDEIVLAGGDHLNYISLDKP